MTGAGAFYDALYEVRPLYGIEKKELPLFEARGRTRCGGLGKEET